MRVQYERRAVGYDDWHPAGDPVPVDTVRTNATDPIEYAMAVWGKVGDTFTMAAQDGQWEHRYTLVAEPPKRKVIRWTNSHGHTCEFSGPSQLSSHSIQRTYFAEADRAVGDYVEFRIGHATHRYELVEQDGAE